MERSTIKDVPSVSVQPAQMQGRVEPVEERAHAHILELDGVRGIAIMLVLVFHSARQVFSIGWMGVDLFFVLSGFLITLGLVKTKGSPHYFQNFYVKRALRIWPIYYLLLAYVYIVSPDAFGDAGSSTVDWLSYVLYVQNLVHPLRSPVELGQMWSLAIEEQFYLVWPLVVWLVPRRALLWLSVWLVVAALVLRLALVPLQVAPWVAYFSTPCRLDALAFGALLSLLVTGSPEQRRSIKPWSQRSLAVGIALGIPLSIMFGSEGVSGALPVEHGLTRACLFSFIGLAGFGVVGLAIVGESRLLSFVLRLRPLRYLGKISYGLYIYHALIFQAVTLQVAAVVSQPDAPLVKLVRAAIGITAAVAVATISWYAIEQPILRLKSRFVRDEPSRLTARAPAP